MRCTQYRGLSDAAIKFLQENAAKKVIQKCPNCDYPINQNWIVEDYSYTSGMFGEEIPLKKYTLKDGTKVKEVVQADPWFSGPVIFITLQHEDGSLVPGVDWDQKTIDEG
jgi:hypothetical protein